MLFLNNSCKKCLKKRCLNIYEWNNKLKKKEKEKEEKKKKRKQAKEKNRPGSLDEDYRLARGEGIQP